MARRRTSSSAGVGLIAVLALAVLVKYYWIVLPLLAVVLLGVIVHVAFSKKRTAPQVSYSPVSRGTTTPPSTAVGNRCPELPGVEWGFYTKVAGVSFDNDDGESRQRVIRRCSVGEQAYLVPEPSNPHDPNAVLVCRANGEQLGHLNRELAHDIMSRGELGSLVAQISDLTGGTWGKPTRGVNLRIGKHTGPA